MSKSINQHFFGKDKESKAMYYVLGAWYGCGTTATKKIKKKDGSSYEYRSVQFQSKTKKLVEIVHRELQSHHEIRREPYKPRRHNTPNGYRFEAMGVPTLCDRLKELGLDKPEEKRAFPEIPESYISHFVRGFFDAKGMVYPRDKRTTIGIRFNSSFIEGLRNVLKKYAHVEGGGKRKNFLSYGHADAIKIHDFIYRDWSYIERRKLYLPFKKRRFKVNHELISPGSIGHKQSLKKIERGKALLVQGLDIGTIAKKLGYSQPGNFRHCFKKVTGMTPKQYERQYSEKTAA